QRPGISPKTVILKRPGETTVPQTITLQRPDAEETTSESSKGATARISVPESAMAATPSSQRKTIMIRRPGAGGPASSARTLTLNRPAASVQAPREDLDEILQSLQTDEPGPVYSILALVAVLLLAALLYVLAAQTIAPTLPVQGRIA
ncbi:MAG: hypothetical protein U1E27_02145, partial [Kiritimatiellia bacterium]|nr:hypothetical protein [Kiritimatiellia bacterium]